MGHHNLPMVVLSDKGIRKLLTSHFGEEISSYDILETIPVLYQGWETDEWAVIIELKGRQRLLVHTNHCQPYIVDNPVEFFAEKVSFYKNAIDKSNSALQSLSD